MEFKKREIKRDNRSSEDVDQDSRQPYSFENKVLVVSVVCEMFEIPKINEIEGEFHFSAINRNYNMETRIRSIVYPIDSADYIREITSHWNKWTEGEGAGKKIQYAVRENKSVPVEEKQEEKETVST